ncbi:MAG: rRNA maturation RNase YbeY [Myxococcales bacterium]|nr:rRNA maturation RNase YbeY [Myxococcales bacterium]
MAVAVRCQGVRYASRSLRSDAVVLLVAIGRPRAELSVLLCNDEFIGQLNAQWRQKHVPTDVLSFSMGGGDLLGDVVVSLDTAKRQADERGHDLHTELRVLLVHGLLHLCDHDHEEEADNVRMAAEENRLLAVLGVAGVGLVARVNG